VLDNSFLGEFKLDNIPPMPRAKPQIEVSFTLDASGILTVSAEEKTSKSSAKITISSKDRLSESEIKKMLHLAEKFEEDDRIARETLEWKNGLEAYAFNVKAKIEEPEVRSILSNDEHKQLVDAVEAALAFLDERHKGLEAIKAQQKSLERVNHSIMSRVYNTLAEKRGNEDFQKKGGQHDGHDHEDADAHAHGTHGAHGAQGAHGAHTNPSGYADVD